VTSLSPPKDLARNKLFRAFLLDRAQKSVAVQRYLMQRCKDDLLFFINAFVWQFNPNSIGEASQEIGPFITWDFQDEACRAVLECLAERRDLVIEKSREMGASWLCLLIMLWFFLFHPWKKFLCISRNEDAVDTPGDSDCLFWKLDFVIERLPDWMVAGRVKRQKLVFTNPMLGGAITGQASTSKAGVGGRATAMFIDEYSLFDNGKDYDVLHHTANTTACRIFNGTQRGVDKAFYELTQRVDYRKLQMHWTQHPDKRRGLYRYRDGKIEVLDKQHQFPKDFNFVMSEAPTGGMRPGLRSPYYDDQCIRQGSQRAVAMNLDGDASGAMWQYFDAIMVRRLQAETTRDPVWVGELHFDPDDGKPLELLPVKDGHLKLWINPTPAGRVPKALYGAGSDVSQGTGATPSVWECINCLTGEQVAEYVNAHIEPKLFAVLCVALCWLFCTEDGEGARFAWEKAGPGVPFGKRVMELGYTNVLKRENESKFPGAERSNSDWSRPGWFPTTEAKLLLLDEYRAALQSRDCVVRSHACLEECLRFKYNSDGKIEHNLESGGDNPTGARENHGDLTIGMALAWKMARRFVTKRVDAEGQQQVIAGSLAWRKLLVDQREREAQVWT